MKITKGGVLGRAISFIAESGLNFPILVGFSGGPDSIFTLITILKYIETRKHKTYKVHVVFIEDSEFSRDPAVVMWLNNIAIDPNIMVHYKTSAVWAEDKNSKNRSSEEVYRNERFAIFKDLYDKNKCEALVLGHHADDRAETVFKRIMEGASIHKLYGMGLVDESHGMKIIRPIIYINKKSIVGYLELNKINFIVDPNNIRDNNLRGKLRSTILPMVSDFFEKDVSVPLCKISDQSRIIESHFNRVCSEAIKSSKISDDNFHIPKRAYAILDEAEKMFLVKSMIDSINKNISRDTLMQIVKSMSEKSKPKMFSCGKIFIIVDKSGVYTKNNRI